jgi:hypothetical protein
VIDHGGEAVGFLTQNTVYPDSKAAIIVFTNADFSSATDTLTEGIEKIVLDSPETKLTGETARSDDVKSIYSSLVKDAIDRSRFTDDLNYYFNATTLGDYRSSLAPLGTPTFELRAAPKLRGGFVNRNFTLHYAGGKTLVLITYAEPGSNGRWEQYIVMPQ